MNTYEFGALIEPVTDTGGSFVRVPIDIRKVFGKGRVKVHATFNNVPYNGSVVNMGVKNADGSIYLLHSRNAKSHSPAAPQATR